MKLRTLDLVKIDSLLKVIEENKHAPDEASVTFLIYDDNGYNGDLTVSLKQIKQYLNERVKQSRTWGSI